MIGNLLFKNSAAKTPTILQLSDTECGIAVLAILFSFYKVNISLEELREQCGTSRDGCKASTLIQVAKKYGFNSAAYTIDIDIIKKLREPVIAFWKFNHYVVINGFKNNLISINDPACGPLMISLDEFDKSFTGIIITITPTKNYNPRKKISIDRFFLRKMIRWSYTDFILILIFLVIATSCSLLNASMSALFIDFCIVSPHQNWILPVTVTFLILVIIYLGSSTAQKWGQFKLLAKSSIAKSIEMIDHILKLPVIFYSLRQKTEIISIVMRIESMVSNFYKSLTSILIHFLTAVICFAFMVRINGNLSVISFILLFFSLIIFIWLSKLNLIYEKIGIYSIGKWQSYLMSCIRNLETIKTDNLENYSFQKGLSFFTKKLSDQDQANAIGIAIDTFSKCHDLLATFSILVFGGISVFNGTISIGNLMVYYALYLIFYAQLTSILQALKSGQSVYAFSSRINDIMSYQQDKRFTNKKSYMISSHILFSAKNVSFFHNKTSSPTLKNINLEVERGQHIAFVGNSGSGKSTLAKLCCGLYQPCSGEIFLFGKNMADLTSEDFSNDIAYVEQESSLFSGTIYENLTLWNDSIPLSEIKQAIEYCCLEELISKIGLYGKLEEHGSHLSGGEKQRIEVARALIQNTSILILDEATSSLDTKTEKQIIACLRKTNKTIFYVAHRLSTIQHCDQIFVLNNGEIVEKGTHEQLIKNKNYYYHLANNELF